VVAVRLARRSERGRLVVDRLVLHVPLLGRFVRKVMLVRFASTLATLLDSGLPALKALETLHRATSNEVMRRLILKVRDSVSEGGGFTEPLENSALFPVMVVRWVEVGEKTATLPEMLNRLASQYEREVDQMIDALIALIEPAMIVFLAVVVGTIVLALFMPLITIIEKIGTA
jgi:type IV pilus assembly protein PilC